LERQTTRADPELHVTLFHIEHCKMIFNPYKQTFLCNCGNVSISCYKGPVNSDPCYLFNNIIILLFNTTQLQRPYKQ